MISQKRFAKRNKVLKRLAIATIASTTLPLSAAEELIDVSHENTKPQPSITIESNQSKTEVIHIQFWGSNFNASRNTNNSKPKEQPKQIVLKSQ